MLSRGHASPPFLPQEFTKLLNIKQISKTSLVNSSATLLRLNDGYIINVNENHSLSRQNFSCAHEIGHILLDELNINRYLRSIEYRTFNPEARRNDIITKREELCDIAASEILMPEQIFKKYLINYDISIYSLEKLASIFKTSIQTTAIRMAEMSPKTCIALLWKPQKNVNTKNLKLAWKAGPGRKSSKAEQYFLVEDSAPINSMIFKAFQEYKSVECYKTFKTRNEMNRLHVESKGFGYGDARYVISLASLPGD